MSTVSRRSSITHHFRAFLPLLAVIPTPELERRLKVGSSRPRRGRPAPTTGGWPRLQRLPRVGAFAWPAFGNVPRPVRGSVAGANSAAAVESQQLTSHATSRSPESVFRNVTRTGD